MRTKQNIIQFSIFLLILISGLLIIGGRACSKQRGGGGNSVGSSDYSFALNAPSGLTAIAMSTTQIDLSWTDNSPNASGFEIERSLITNTTYTLLATVSRGINIYSDTPITPYSTYYYRVRAFNPIGDRSDWSNGANAFTFDYGLLPPFVAIAAGYGHTLALGSDGILWSWGLNDSGQLGVGDWNNRIFPTLIASDWNYGIFNNIATIAAGSGSYGYTIALKTDGTLWGWGANGAGQLGTGDSYTYEAPYPVTGTNLTTLDSDWASFTAGRSHTIALKTTGTLWTWGDNAYGQLGLGDSGNGTNRNTPAQIGTDSDWFVLAAGDSHSLGLKTNPAGGGTGGTLWSWGINWYGQLGLGDTTNRNTPTQVGTDSDWSIVAAGGAHTIARKTNNTIWSWGVNSYGQLGLGDITVRNTPTQVGTDSDWSVLAAGSGHSLGLKTNPAGGGTGGTLWAWGNNTYSQLGLGDTNNKDTPTQVGTDSDWSVLAAGSGHSLGLKTNGSLWVWGNNQSGQLGLGDTINRNTPRPLGLDRPAQPSSLIASSVSSSQINLSWADNSYNETGFIIERSTSPATGYSLIATISANITSYSADSNNLVPNTTYYYRIRAFNAFGDSFSSNEVGVFNLDYNFLPTWSAVAAGYGHTVVLGNNGTLWAWGLNAGGQLGLGNADNLLVPNPIRTSAEGGSASGGNWQVIGCGQIHTLALKTDGTLWSWGSNVWGQLGAGDTDYDSWEPFPVGMDSDWSQFTAGALHTFGLKTNGSAQPPGGTLWGWGDNFFSELGPIAVSGWTIVTPTQMGMDSDWSAVVAGGGSDSAYTLALKTNGTLWSWGYNGSGQLGLGSGLIYSPTPIGTDSDWLAFVAGEAHTLAIKTNRTLWAWGYNGYGQLGLGDTDNRNRPNQLGNIPSPHPALTATLVSLSQMDLTWSDIDSEKEFQIWRNGILLITRTANTISYPDTTVISNTTYSYRVKSVNDVGESFSGAVSLLITDTNVGQFMNASSFPTNGRLDSDWSSVAAGGNHTIARKTNGTIWSWGNNGGGQLGLGDWADRNIPTQVGIDSDWSVIAAGWYHSLGIKTNGSLWVWGWNNYGQLGLGDAVDRNIPCPLGSPAPPSNLIATAVSSSQIDLSWTDNSFNAVDYPPPVGAEQSGVPTTVGETGFRIERSTNGTNYDLLTTTNANTTSYSDIGFPPNILYYYRVRAYNTFGVSPFSTEATPITLTAQAMAYNRIDLIWTSVTAAQSYLVERGTMAGGPYTTISTTNATVTSYSDMTCSPTTTYYYRVYAYYANGDTMPSVEASATTPTLPPDAPMTLTAQAISSFCIALTWANVTSETGYKIERSFISGGPYTLIAQRTTDVITYTDTTVTPLNTYYYQVQAYNAGGQSGYSPEANATTPQIPPPNTVTATIVSSSGINLTWIDVIGEDGYNIYRSTDNITFTQIATPTKNSTFYLDSGLSASQSYYYYIKSYYAGVESTISTSATATTLPNPPDTPNPLSATALSSYQIALTWTNVANETGYTIERSSDSTSGPWTWSITRTADTTTYQDSECSPETTYYYHICAYNAGGQSSWTSPVSATTSASQFPPDTPSPMTAIAVSSTGISITWTNVADETGYTIERSFSSASGPWQWSITRTAETITYQDSGLSANTPYYYQVYAYNGSGNSVSAATADTWTRLSAPDALTATALSSSQIALTWTNVTGETGGYKIYRGSISGGPYTQIGTTAQNVVTYTDTTVTASHTYYYRVRAPNAGGDSAYSPVAYATTAGNWSTALSVPPEGYSAFIGCKTDGTLWTWGGSGTPYQVGTGTNWLAVSGTNLSTVAAGDGYSQYYFARQTNGTLWSWGDNDAGQLGLGDTINRNTPTQVLGSSSDWSQVACGQFFTLAIKTNRTIWSCGDNFFGQLGWGTQDYAVHPTFTSIADSDWSMVASGVGHSIARKTNGTIWTWGNDFDGQLGDPTIVNTTIPNPIGTTSDWSLITAGGYYTAAIKTNGTLWVWGRNDRGQLGLGYLSNIVGTPTQESTSASDWSAVAGGVDNTIALKTNGSLWAWGYGYGGATPSQIGSDTDWTTIKGGLLSIARKINGTLWVVNGNTTTLVGE
jgi:alpha-tubulin suppressor-like RCC1 family protein/fibronectin type 3 domain-containing protein